MCSRVRWRQSRTRISHRDERAAGLGFAGTNDQLSRPIARSAHCLDSVHDQVEDHLLQFDPVSCNERQGVRELGPNGDAVLHRFPTGELDHIADRSVDLQEILPWRRSFDEITDPVDDVAR